MASPFKAFRKHQKALIVFFGILLMISFLIVPPMLQWYGTNEQAGVETRDDTVLTWRDGSLNEVALSAMLNSNRVAARFTADITEEARKRGGLPQAQPIQPASSEADVVQRMLLAKKAEELGIVVDDAAVSAYLNELGNGRVTAAERGKIFADLTQNSGSQSDLWERLRLELLAQRMEVIALAGYASAGGFGGWEFHRTPIDAWNSYNNLFRMVSVELYPVAVKDYVAKVKNPTESEISAYYEEHKNNVADPRGTEPGFRTPPRSRFAYVKADFAKFLEEEKQKVTAEQVQKYYDENKEKFRETELPAVEGTTTPAGSTSDAKPEQPAVKPEGEVKPPATATPPAEGTKTPTTPSSTTPEGAKADGAKPDEAKPNTGKPSEGAPAPKADAGESPEKPADPPNKSAGKDSDPPAEKNPAPAGQPDPGAALRRPARSIGEDLAFAPEVLAALQADAAESPQSAEQPPEKPQAEGKQADGELSEPKSESAPPPAGEKAQGDDSKAASPAGEAKAEDEKSATEKTGAEKTGDEKATPPADGAVDNENKEEETPVKYKPLKDVEDQIRTELADKAAARKKMLVQIEKVKSAVNRYKSKFTIWRANNFEKDPNSPERPKPPSPAELAKGLMLSAQTTALLDPFALMQLEFGKLIVGIDDDKGQPQDRKSFMDYAMMNGAVENLFVPEDFLSPRSSEPTTVYLFWRVEQHPEFIPTLEQARKQVVQAWKKQQAQPLAEKAARDLAEKARQQPGASLEQSLGKRAFTTDQFNRTSFDGQPTRSVTGVDVVGPEFLDAVFALKAGGIGVAMDGLKADAYVIRLAEESSPEQQRRDNFMRIAGNSGFLLRNMGDNLYGEWMRDLVKEMDLKWKRPLREAEL